MPFGFGKGYRSKGRGWGRGRGGFRPGGPPGNCICSNCGFIVPYRVGLPCFQTKCPQCGSVMTRQFFYGK